MIIDSIVIITVIIGDHPIFKESFLALKRGQINMELSMIIAIIISLLLLQILPDMVLHSLLLVSIYWSLLWKKAQRI